MCNVWDIMSVSRCVYRYAGVLCVYGHIFVLVCMLVCVCVFTHVFVTGGGSVWEGRARLRCKDEQTLRLSSFFGSSGGLG